MGAAALAARLPVRPRTRARPASCGLDFARTPGPLVAICGLVGGSGASTLALALARQAARESSGAVLLTEFDGERAGLAMLADRAGDTSLTALAREVHDGHPPARPFVEIEPRLRLVAAPPRQEEPPTTEAMRSVLAHARDAHGLVVVDCGTSWPAAGVLLAEATHLLWTIPARAPAISRAWALFGSPLLPAPGNWREALVATATARPASASVRSLRRLAAARCERLILSPFAEAVARGEPPRGEPMGRTLTALAPFLGRP